jgi:CIC family chloride channel protein
MVAAHFILRTVGGGATPSTSDEYLKRFHQEGGVLGGKPFRGRVLASAVALGTGNMLGLEGPAIYLGASAGATVQRRLPRLFGRIDHRLLLVAGAAGGVAAVFRAPATGAIFAIESPYQGDLAHSSLLPALIGASTGYVTFSLLLGNEPLFPVEGATDVMVPQLGIALLVGAVAGLVARWGASALALAKRLSTRGPDWRRLLLAGTVISATSVAVRLAADTPGVLGPGYGLVNWALEDNRAIWALVIILIARNLGTAASVAGGGPGGLFVPLVVAGALLGRLCGELIGTESTTLYPVIGIAAVLGAGYRVPLAAVMFVAETTGRPGFVVPGLLAAVAAELMMGSHSFTAYQKKAQLVSGNRRSRGAGRGSDPLTGEIRMVGSEADGAPPVSTGRTLVTGEQPPVAEVVRPPSASRPGRSWSISAMTVGDQQPPAVAVMTGEVRHLTGEMKPITGRARSRGLLRSGTPSCPSGNPTAARCAPPAARQCCCRRPSVARPDPDADAEVEAAEAEVEAAADANAHADRDAGSDRDWRQGPFQGLRRRIPPAFRIASSGPALQQTRPDTLPRGTTVHCSTRGRLR